MPVSAAPGAQPARYGRGRRARALGWRGLALAELSLLWAVFACTGGAALERRAGLVEAALRGIEEGGAMVCAPRELAVARSHFGFAQLEREQGFPSRAEAHLDVADENIRAARVLASSTRCGGTGR